MESAQRTGPGQVPSPSIPCQRSNHTGLVSWPCPAHSGGRFEPISVTVPPVPWPLLRLLCHAYCMPTCQYRDCGVELAQHPHAGRPRKFCSPSHSSMARRDRNKRNTCVPPEPDKRNNPPAVPGHRVVTGKVSRPSTTPISAEDEEQAAVRRKAFILDLLG
jgi:hypothetical protein